MHRDLLQGSVFPCFPRAKSFTRTSLFLSEGPVRLTYLNTLLFDLDEDAVCAVLELEKFFVRERFDACFLVTSTIWWSLSKVEMTRISSEEVFNSSLTFLSSLRSNDFVNNIVYRFGGIITLKKTIF